MSDTIVRLNVGGRVFETTETTLRYDGNENFFSVLLSGRTPSLRDSSGAFFIDRDPDYFTVILRFLRTRKLEVDGTGLILTSLYDEALFYSLDSIADIILEQINSPGSIAGTGAVCPFLNGAYVNDGNTKAIVFTHCGNNDETEKRILLVEDSSVETSLSPMDAFSQAKVARAAVALPTLWDEMNKVDYAAFFYRYIKRGRFHLRCEAGSTFISLIVPGGEMLTQNKMAVLTNLGKELLVFSSPQMGNFVKFTYKAFSE